MKVYVKAINGNDAREIYNNYVLKFCAIAGVGSDDMYCARATQGYGGSIIVHKMFVFAKTSNPYSNSFDKIYCIEFSFESRNECRDFLEENQITDKYIISEDDFQESVNQDKQVRHDVSRFQIG